MKVAFILTMHQSKNIRPNGIELVDQCLRSIQKSVEEYKEYKVFLNDNTSEEKINLEM